MYQVRSSNSEFWASRWTFVAAGSCLAVGFGNFWRFGSAAGEHGGLAFVVVYMATLVLVGLPLLMAESIVGRRGASSPMLAMAAVAAESGRTPIWRLIAVFGLSAAVLGAALVTVLGGWSLAWLELMTQDAFAAASVELVADLFQGMLSNADWQVRNMTIVLVIAAALTALEKQQALALVQRVLMALLLIVLLALAFIAWYWGDGGAAIAWMLELRTADISTQTFTLAVSQALLTLGVGYMAIMAFAANSPLGASLFWQAIWVVAIDAVVALLAGYVIYALILDHHIIPGDGPALIFVSLPYALGNVVLGDLIGAIFFSVLFLVALTSAIALLEGPTSWLQDKLRIPRAFAVWIVSIAIWFLAATPIYSFTFWDKVYWMGYSPLEWFDIAIGSVLLPLALLMLSLFAGFRIERKWLREELNTVDRVVFWVWRGSLRFVAPFVIIWIALASLSQRFTFMPGG